LRLDTLKTLEKEYDKFFQTQVDLTVKKVFQGLGQQQTAHNSLAVDLSTHKAKGHYLWVMYTKPLQAYVPVTPRLPSDISSLLLSPQRRRTIGEPERLRLSLKLLYETREAYASIVNLTEDNYQLRRQKRSFDFGEIWDETHGLMDEMDYGFNDYRFNAHILNDEVYSQPFVMGSGAVEEVAGAAEEEEEDWGRSKSAKLKPKTPGRLSKHQRQVKIDQTHFKKDLLHIEQRMVVLRYTEASEEIVQLTKEHLAEKKKLDLLKAHAARAGEDETRDTLFAAMEMLSGKMSDKESGSAKSQDRNAKKKEKRARRRRQSMSRSSFSGNSATLSSGHSDDEHSLASGSAANVDRVLRNVRNQLQSEDWAVEGYEETNSANPDGSLVEIWQVYYTTESQEYYFNPLTQQSMWSLPEEAYYYDANGSLVYLQVESQYQNERGDWLWYNHSTLESRYM